MVPFDIMHMRTRMGLAGTYARAWLEMKWQVYEPKDQVQIAGAGTVYVDTGWVRVQGAGCRVPGAVYV